MKISKIYWSGWILFFPFAELVAQSRLPVLLELEGGIEWLGNTSVRRVFPAGGSLKLGPVFAMADQGRLRLRPQAGFKLFFNELDEWTTEHLRMIRLGGQVSYDLFYVGHTTFFPYAAADFNWVANYDAESDGSTGDAENTTFSDSYLKGSGFSTEVGMRIQYREFYIKLGYEVLNPRLRVKGYLIDEDLEAGYMTPPSHLFNFNAVNLSVGITIGP
ncbi:hypothetical protein ACFOET_16685 [Parapedobacter deserti]|uniref:Outer membrane protein beta-barrel domain-containing protein n=1 Tax=Parapedobacter deserti TaxID=1912957 RepID=A0ABV7JMD9_9SPHI